jgi:hypothetical protein
MNQICKHIIARSGLLNKLSLIKNYSTNVSLPFKRISAAPTLALGNQIFLLSNPFYRKFYSTETQFAEDDDERPRYKKSFSYNDRGGQYKRPQFGEHGRNRSFGGHDRYPSKFGDSKSKITSRVIRETSSTVEDFAGAEQIETSGAEIDYQAQGEVK